MWSSFFAGLLSFFSPCIFPLIPVYVSFVTGYSLEELKDSSGIEFRLVFVRTMAFIIGFALIFTSMGAASSGVGEFLVANKILLARISGVVVVLLGLQVAGVVNVDFMARTRRFDFRFSSKGVVPSFVFGLIFAVGWSPCVGPMLSFILILAAGTASVAKGMILLFLYSVGIGLPFLVFAFSINYFFKASGFLRRLDIIQMISGLLLVVAGIYLIYNGGF